jgi:type IV pilus assembly protein PilO
VSAMTLIKPKSSNGSGNPVVRNWLTPLNLHWAGVGLLALVNIYILAQMAFLWHASSKYNADAMAEQRIKLKTAEIAAVPLRGLDAKLATATEESNLFYRERLPASHSEVLAELGVLTKRAGVRLVRVQYTAVTVLVRSEGELSADHMDATLSGDYRPLMLMLNSLERDRMFFVINAVTLTGQQSGTVNLRLRLTTFLRPEGSQDLTANAASAGTDAETTAIGGPAL